jgi:formate-dependent nitrite reductase cytochrome c552 subunit
MAAKKVVAVAFHPSGKLITNVMEFNKGAGRYTPIFTADGKEEHVGNLSCPSCHNAHQWGIPADDEAAGNRAKHTLTKNFRFLRTMSYNAVCKDCHGPEGFFRYLYFHDPARRTTRIRP